MVYVYASLPVFVDDLLENPPDRDRVLVPDRPPTRCSTALKSAVTAEMKKPYVLSNLKWVLRRYSVSRERGGLLSKLGVGRKTVVLDVTVVHWKPTWSGSAAYWNFVWEIKDDQAVLGGPLRASELDLGQIRETIYGGITDGWGEGAQQVSRFGPMVVYDDQLDKHRPASASELNPRSRPQHLYVQPRYALLLTLRGATINASDTMPSVKSTPKSTPKPRSSPRSSPKSTAKRVRPSPSDSATLFAPGTLRRGNDGRMYVIKTTANGVHRWVPVNDMV
jgi:hypothetical protein